MIEMYNIYPCITATTCTWFCLVRPATPSIFPQKAEAPATDCSFFSSRFFRAACFRAYTIDCTLPCIIGREILLSIRFNIGGKRSKHSSLVRMKYVSHTAQLVCSKSAKRGGRESRRIREVGATWFLLLLLFTNLPLVTQCTLGIFKHFMF